jgi:putative Mg2+ transporter-C (MgtC) family protein
VLGSSGDPLRIAAQVVSGIGFLGVGTILIKGRFQITGLTTAAGLWTSAAIGLALGAGFYEGALVTTVLAIVTITVVHFLEYRINNKYSRFGIYIEIRSDKDVRRAIDFIKENFRVGDIQVTGNKNGATCEEFACALMQLL